MLAVLNIAFFVFHTALILFNVLGWIWRPTRRWNLATLLVTLFSWTVMGYWYGAGYCVCTDLHWRVRREMGIRDEADSYLVLMVRLLTGWDPPVPLVNAVAGTVFLFSLVMSVGLNLRDRRKLHSVA
ncbi:DUF2784 family protein [bacterium]|nr:MAG: DUF2784 family protein [bacterium]